MVSKKQRLRDVHERALIEFDSIQSAVRDERLQCLEDRRFYSIAGAQWEGSYGDQFENRPKMEVNKIHLSVIRIINEYRNNRISVDFVSKDGASDDKLAGACDMLYRAGEEYSTADEAYDNAFEEAAAGGFGAWRLTNEYEDEADEENDKQRIQFEPIFDADSCVFFDMDAKRQDKADATRCFVLNSMTTDSYEDEFGESPTDWPKEIHQSEFDWCVNDMVYVAEYYVVENKQRTIYTWRTLTGEEIKLSEEELESQIEKLEATGAKQIKQKKVKTRRVRKYIMSGGGILEDCGHIAGPNIPVIPMYGKRWYIDGVERCMGHVRLAKDAQRLKNMQLSRLAEISSLSAVEKPILSPEQVAGHELMWANDNIQNYPYLLINPVTDINGNEIPSPPLGYTKPPAIPPALAALLQITEDDISGLLGNQQNGEEISGNISTETAHLIQNRLDMQTYIYMSNMSKAIKRCGEVWLGMAKEVFVEDGRKMRGVGKGGEMSTVELRRLAYDENQSVVYENDLSKADFDVTVEVGPSSSTKRASTVRSLSAMLSITDDPETKQVLGAMAMMNMEGEGVSEVRDYFRQKLIKMGVVKPNEEEQQKLQEEMANAKPSPQDEYLQAAAQKEQTEATKNQVETIREQAQADKIRAETQQILGTLDLEKLKTLVDVVEKLGPRVEPQLQGTQNVE